MGCIALKHREMGSIQHNEVEYATLKHHKKTENVCSLHSLIKKTSSNQNIVKIEQKLSTLKHHNRNSLSTYEKGISAELCAKNYLIAKGYTIIAQRIRNEYGEIDILAQYKNNIVAFEVKQRQTLNDSKSCLTKRQMSRIARAFSLIIANRNEMFENYRIDIVCFDKFGKFEHIENAFYIEEVA